MSNPLNPNESNPNVNNDDSSNLAETARFNRQGIPTNSSAPTVSGRAPNDTQQAPGRRLYNPLSEFASYTYQLSLYMVTPEAYNAFIASGRKNINALGTFQENNPYLSGAYLVAQSGGINNSVNARPPGMDLDYYIDNLTFKTAFPTSSQTSAALFEVSFNIYEPYGFSFITKLSNAVNALQSAGNPKFKNWRLQGAAPGASFRQFYILGIKFQGYDINGKALSSSDLTAPDTTRTTNSPGVFERYYDIFIKDMKFKIDGKTTVYNVTATSTGAQTAFSNRYGMVDNNLTIVAGTVEEALTGTGQGIVSLIKTLNDKENALVANNVKSIPNTYNIQFIGDSDRIKKATLNSPADPSKLKLPFSNITRSSEVSDASSVNNSSVTLNKTTYTIPSGTPILQVINGVIKSSSYLEESLEIINSSTFSNQGSPNNLGKKNPDDVKPIRWFFVSPEIKVKDFDPIVNDFAFEITYVIQPYETPAVASPYIKQSRYYGPHKRYRYWYTGQNQEVISFEAQIDNLFQNIVTAPIGTDSLNLGIPTKVNTLNNWFNEGRTNLGYEVQNTYVTNLYAPKSWGNAKLEILGDPDYLVQETPGSLNELLRLSEIPKFYGLDNFTINPNGGQVFIELEFNEGIDYNNELGVMDVNTEIFFVKYKKEVADKIKGMVFLVKDIVHSFSRGKFTQTLSTIMPTYLTDGPNTSKTTSPARQPAATPTTPNVERKPQGASASSTTPNTGNQQKIVPNQKSDPMVQPPVSPTSVNVPFVNAKKNLPVTIPTAIGPVATDDSFPTPPVITANPLLPNQLSTDPRGIAREINPRLRR